MSKGLINDHKQFLYKGGVETGRIFEKGDEIPEGYFDRPNATEWDNKPEQPKMKMAMVWENGDQEEIPAESEEPEPAPTDAMYCAECDKEYKDHKWYALHMKEKHDIVVGE